MALKLCMTQGGVRCNKRTEAVAEKPKKVSKFTMVCVLMFFVFCAGVMYIFQVNRLATMGYEIKKTEKTIEELKKQNESLKIEAAELKSMHNLESDKDRMKMRKPEEIGYIEIDEPVAMK